jgi:hypothetical protein
VAGLTYVHDAVGSIVTRDGRDLAAGDSVDLAIFDERYDKWRSPYPLGGATFASLQALRNALIVTDDTARLGYSIQRDDVVGMPAAVLPIVTTQVEEDTAVLRDSANMLYAFGSPEKTHDMFDYPLDTETQHFSSAVFAGQIVHITVRGAPGNLALLGIGAAFLSPPLPVLGGCLSIAPPYVPGIPSVVIGGTGVADFTVALPMMAGPVTVWAQGASFNLVTFSLAFTGCKAEPIEIF